MKTHNGIGTFIYRIYQEIGGHSLHRDNMVKIGETGGRLSGIKLPAKFTGIRQRFNLFKPAERNEEGDDII